MHGFVLRQPQLLPYQQEGIAAMRGKTNVLLADEMGLGKTVQAIGVMNEDPDIKRVLIVCPASLKLNWRNELMIWADRSASINIVGPGAEWVPTDIVIMNYEQVPKYRPEIDKVEWDLLVCDESHYLKNNKAMRTRVIVGHWDRDDPSKRIWPIKAKRRLFLTGTPILNKPKELWTTVRALDKGGLGRDWLHFHTRYCAGYKDAYGWQIDGASNLEELQSKLRGSIMIRRKKKDVLKDLPAKRRQIIMLEPTTDRARKALEAERELGEIEKEMEELRAKVEAMTPNEADSEYKKMVQRLVTMTATAFADTSRIRHQTALAKLPMVMDHLVNVLESENKIVVFGYHHGVIDGLREGFAEYGVVVVDGRTKMEDRQKAVESFQQDPKVRVIIGSIGAMGVGWTLTAASYVAFAELDWVPGNISQAEDRLHRIGQHDSVLVQHLMLNGSMDGRMAKTIVSKQRVIERATG